MSTILDDQEAEARKPSLRQSVFHILGNRWTTAGAVALILMVGGLVTYMTHEEQAENLSSEAGEVLSNEMDRFTRSVNGLFLPAERLHKTLEDGQIYKLRFDQASSLFFGASTGPIRRFDQINGAYLGFPDGRFMHLQTLIPPHIARHLAPDYQASETVRRVISDPQDNPAGTWFSNDRENSNWVEVPNDIKKDYDPRVRPWYAAALENPEGQWTNPYVFASSGQLGITYSKPIYDNLGTLWAVFGVDLSLSSLSETLTDAQADAADDARQDLVFATDFEKRIVGHPEIVTDAAVNSEEILDVLHDHMREDSLEWHVVEQVANEDQVTTVLFEGGHYLAMRTHMEARNGPPISIFVARDMDEILADAFDNLHQNTAILFAVIVVIGVVSFYAVKLQAEVFARQQAEAELLEARDIAEAATKAKSTFLATMSHEIRTPMNGVMSMAEMLTQTRMNAEQGRMTKIIYDSASALLTIINDILDFSKIEAGKLDIESISFSIRETVEGTGELLAGRAEDRDVGMAVLVAPDMPDLRLGDPVRIRQILLNLGGNAIKFTEQGAVRLDAFAVPTPEGHEGDAWIRFEVTDSGIGLTEEQVAKLFQPFVQADSSTARKYGGTGLGLSICQRLCEMMGGRIGVTSTFGEGSTFWFELPLAPDSEGQGGLEPPPEVQDLGVILAGIPEVQRPALSAYLSTCGVAWVEEVADFDSVPEHPALNHQGPTLELLDATLATDQTVQSSPTQAFPVILGTRQTLNVVSKEWLSRAKTAQTYPLPMEMVRKIVHAAVGLETLSAASQIVREDMQFSAPTADEAAEHKALILVAEDNPNNQIVVRQMLDRMGFACEIHDNGALALAAYRPEAHGLILTDFHMPEMDGFELTRQIRQQEADTEARVPIIALTADALTGVEQECKAVGMDGYLTKPINSKRLSKTLTDFLPAALPLRKVQEMDATPEDEATPAAGDAPAESVSDKITWDPEIFDPQPLTDTFGAFDGDALDFLDSVSGSWALKLTEIEAATANDDKQKLRDVAHDLKGSALMAGANRLGRIASDIQDFCDQDDMDMAKIMAEILPPTFEEFQATLPAIKALRG